MSVVINGYEVAKSNSSYGRWVMFDRNQHWFFQSKVEAVTFASYCPRLA